MVVRLKRRALTSIRKNGNSKNRWNRRNIIANFADVFVENLPRYFNGKERVGVSLTGGLDTRIIMAWHKAEPNSLPCYTFGSMYRDNEDVKLARRVAQRFAASRTR